MPDNFLTRTIKAMKRCSGRATYGSAFHQAGIALANVNKRLTEAEKTIAWLKSCKEGNPHIRNFSRRMPQSGDTIRISPDGWEINPGPDKGKKNPDASA